MLRTGHVVTLLAAALIGGCAQEQHSPNEDRVEGLELSLLTGTEIAGTFVTPQHAIAFVIAEPEANRIELDLIIDSTTIRLDVDLNSGEAAYDIPPMVLEEGRVAALTALALALIDTMEGPDKTIVEDQLLRATAYLARAPIGVKLSSFEFQAAKGWTHISCGCFRKYIGNGHYRTAGKGSWCTGGSGNGCKGRCGIGCGWGGRGAYTRDCAQHDYGLLSWTRASDDFTFAGWNC